MLRSVCVAFALVAAALPATAQTEIPTAVSWEAASLPKIKAVQIPLTADQIERFIASLPPLISLARDLDREQGRAEPIKLDEDLAFVLVPYLFDPKIEAHINEKLAGFGFASYADWANVAHSIALVEEAASFTGSVDLGGQEQAARAEIESNAALSVEDKAKALEELKSQFAALAEFEPLPGNRDIVAPYLERLRAARGS
jgi:hypothetical protein